MKLPVSSRVAASRIIGLAVVLSLGGILGAIPSAAAAREFRAADIQVEEYPTVQALLFKPFEAAMAGLYAEAERDPATAELIERIRKVSWPW
jgi:hypothetical protein